MADFKLGRIKFKWRGDWAASTSYVLDDIAKYGGNTYVCIKNHVSPASETDFYTSPGTFTEYWQVHGESIYFKGAYANATWYKLNDLVTYGGKQYRCTTAHTSASLVLDSSKFEQFVDSITFRGDYASSTQYRLNDIVKYGGRQYRVTTEYTSAAGGDPNIDLTKFTLFSEGLAFKGDFTVSTFYKLDDVVKYGSYQYRCTTAHTSGSNLSDFAQANFSVYSEGLQFEDSYNASTLYSKGDVVTYGGYSYVYINAEESTGQTPADNSYWDVVTTGFNATGLYVHGTLYKTGDTVQYGGNSYVCILDAQNQRPSNANGTVNSTYWKGVVEGFKWQGNYSAVTTYTIGDTVRFASNSYVNLKDQVLNVEPGSDSTTWQAIAQGDTAAVMTSIGDMIVQDAGGVARLPLGLPGGVLTNDGDDILWSGISGKNVLWVAPKGTDGGPGTESLPYKTLAYACKHAKSNSIREYQNVTGGTGGTQSVYNEVQGYASKELTVTATPSTTQIEIQLTTSAYAHTYVSGGTVRKADDTTLAVSASSFNHSTGIVTLTTPTHGLAVGNKIRVWGLNYTCKQAETTIGKVYPETGSPSLYRVDTTGGGLKIEIINGGAYHNVGDKIRIDGADIGGAAALNFDVKSVAGDIIRLKNGTFKEQLPMVVKENVSVVGESLRNTIVMPAAGTGTQIKTVKLTGNVTGAVDGIYKYLHPLKTEKSYSVKTAANATTITIEVGTDARTHTYVDGGTVTRADYTSLDVTNAVYNNGTGIITITTGSAHSLSAGDVIKVAGLKYHCKDGEKVYPKVGNGSIWNITIDGGVATQVITYHGGSNYHVGDVITIGQDQIGGSGGNITLTVASLENNNACNFFLLNDKNNIRNMTFTGLNGRKQSGGLYPVTVGSTTSLQFDLGTSAYVHNYISGGSVTTDMKKFTVGTVPDSTSFTISLDTSAVSHTYLDGGTIRKSDLSELTVTNAPFVHGTGVITITTSGAHGLSVSDVVQVKGLRYSCNMGVKTYPENYEQYSVAAIDYAYASGILTVDTTTPHGLLTGDYATVGKMKFTCDLGEKIYPSGPIQQAVMSLDPSGNILIKSPYMQNCTSVNAGACGMQVDGNLHKNTYPRSYKSMLGNDFTQINDDGIGIHILGKGRVEAVSVFIYYCEKAIYAESGGFIRALNCSHSYGEKACVASGTEEDEVPVNVQTRGLMLMYNPLAFGGTATASDIEDSIAIQGQGAATITGGTSGATATLFRHNVALNYLNIETITGNFIQGETITITKEDTSAFTVDLSATFGDSTGAQAGQRGPLLAVKSGTTALTSANIIKLAANIKFDHVAKYYRVGLVSEEDTTGGTAVIRLTEDIGLSKAQLAGVSTNITEKYSNIRMTGHDFLNIGTGGFDTTNYPHTPTQPADQADEVTEENGGRVYWVSTDQDGDFRVGDLFKIEQATGTATLNADAFNLSGLSELKLGSIGAELGAAVNEFSTDQTLGGNSNTAVPTENAVLGYMTRDKAGTGMWVPPTGTSAQRPVTPYAGAIRYNTSLIAWEGYNGASWTGLGGGTPWTAVSGDGSTTTTASSGQRFLVNTSAFAHTINLPGSPLTGDSVTVLDVNGTFQTNPLTIGRNGNDIMNIAEDMTAEVNHAGFTLVYTGGANGWKLVEVA